MTIENSYWYTVHTIASHDTGLSLESDLPKTHSREDFQYNGLWKFLKQSEFLLQKKTFVYILVLCTEWPHYTEWLYWVNVYVCRVAASTDLDSVDTMLSICSQRELDPLMKTFTSTNPSAFTRSYFGTNDGAWRVYPGSVILWNSPDTILETMVSSSVCIGEYTATLQSL